LDLLGFVRQNPDISSVTAEKIKEVPVPFFLPGASQDARSIREWEVIARILIFARK
jgi:hypothetical protein